MDDKIEQLPENQAFITIKDHKPNFPNNIKCRLINPTKSNLGKISKQILQEINKVHLQSTDLQQWQSTPAVIAWFKDFPNKERCKFLIFDVVDYYPSISEKLLDNALMFAKQFVTISKYSINIIHHCKKSIFFSRDSAWIKSDGSLFDVTIGSYDGAEVCELVCLFMLNLIAPLVGKNNVGLYRDDGLAILKNASGPESERIKKKVIKIFQQYGLSISADTNLVLTDFLDVTFNLKLGKYWPYRKPNDQSLYIHQQSNHPPTIKKQLPSMLAKRLSLLSCNCDEFFKAISDYVEAMRRSGHSDELEYENDPNCKPRKTRKQNIVWFNPPFSENVKPTLAENFCGCSLSTFLPIIVCTGYATRIT